MHYYYFFFILVIILYLVEIFFPLVTTTKNEADNITSSLCGNRSTPLFEASIFPLSVIP